MKYLVFYDNLMNSGENRYVVPSCQSKAEYIMAVLLSLGIPVDVISPSCTRSVNGFFPAKTYSVDENLTVHLPATLGVHSLVGKIIRRIWQWMATNLFVFCSVKRKETIIAYHSVALSGVLCVLKRIKKVKLILHVEEIYSDVSQNKRQRKKEMAVFKQADAFLFPTRSLNRMINTSNRPFAIAHGVYKAEQRIAPQYEDGRVHCVYAGTFDAVKGGSAIAIAAAEFLDENYCLHVIGFGSDREIQAVEAAVEEIRKRSKCEIQYDGLKQGTDFIVYIQKCHIGISSQTPLGKYNNTSFPSKVLTYLINGLKVVSVRIPVLEESSVNELLYYYDSNDPRQLAKVIMDCANGCGDTDCAEKIEHLNTLFSANVEKIMKEI